MLVIYAMNIEIRHPEINEAPIPQVFFIDIIQKVSHIVF